MDSSRMNQNIGSKRKATVGLLSLLIIVFLPFTVAPTLQTSAAGTLSMNFVPSATTVYPGKTFNITLQFTNTKTVAPGGIAPAGGRPRACRRLDCQRWRCDAGR